MVRGLESSLLVFAVATLMLLTGCPHAKQANSDREKKDAAPSRASVALRVLVVNEPGVAEGINRLRGEWAERSGGELSASSSEWNDIAGAKSLEADVVIFPSRYLGELCARDWLQPVRSSVLDDEAFDGKDVYPVVRRELMRWGGQVMALPLGIDLVVPGKQNKSHPGLSLLAIAAPAAVSNEREGVLFEPQTMKPRITDAVFVEALQRLAKTEPANRSEKSGNVRTVPVLGFSDRLLGVTSSSRNGASAFKLAAWLASAETSTQIELAGERMLPVRKSLVASSAWHDPGQSADDRAEPAKSLESALNGEWCLLVPRIPGVDEYMAALDDATKSPAPDKTAAEAALQKVAERWEQITNTHGREAQRRAYLKHLQISE